MIAFLFSYGEVSFIVLIFKKNIVCMAGLVEVYCVNLFLSWNSLVSPSMVIESFAGYSSLGWHLCSLRLCITSAKDLLIS